MLAALAFFALLTPPAPPPAQLNEQPQLLWQGEVDGTVVLRIRGRRASVEERSGLPVQRQRAEFREPLPEKGRTVRLEVLEGRGRARILEQPAPRNDYMLTVEIQDPQSGISSYSLAFFWEPERFDSAPPRPMRLNNAGSLTWSGRVDGEVVVSCRGQECESEARTGRPVVRERFRFSRPLPRREVDVSLEEAAGRGTIRLIEQPREDNGYTARVLIRDTHGGGSDYSFALAWNPPRRDEIEPGRRGMVWSGRVDGRVRVIVEGRGARSEVVSGAPVARERADFDRALPARDEPNASVRRLRGRGRVEIVEYPSRRNGYRLIFEIHDSGGGAADYEVEVLW
jgi:hypothetical protein